MSGIEVVEAGPSTTIQDLGRGGLQADGVSLAGWADPLLARLANALLEQGPDNAGLEWSGKGDTLRVTGELPIRVAVAAWAPVWIDGHAASPFRSLRLWPGQVLRVGTLSAGRHGVLAVQGGVQVPVVLGSRSTHARTGLGGGVLRDAQVLPVHPDDRCRAADRWVPVSGVPMPTCTLRVLAGPQLECFESGALNLLESSTWRVGAADRMGVRFLGPPLPILAVQPPSEGVVPGALQVAGDGLPIALGQDCQTIGGYAKPACVIRADLRHLAQLRAGDSVRFIVVSPEVADGARREAQDHVRRLLTAIDQVHTVEPWESARLLRLLG